MQRYIWKTFEELTALQRQALPLGTKVFYDFHMYTLQANYPFRLVLEKVGSMRDDTITLTQDDFHLHKTLKMEFEVMYLGEENVAPRPHVEETREERKEREEREFIDFIFSHNQWGK